ncbi:MAG: DNA glycosylase AlkZ-like family protein [Candidatus Dormibacteria bacterium]
MNVAQLRRLRLASQRLASPGSLAPEAIVAHLGAVQAQDLAAALWALGLRSGAAQHTVRDLLDAGVVLRTHVLRPTWHLVMPADVHWMLQLTAPRIAAGNDRRLRQLGVMRSQLERCLALIEQHLGGGNHRTRMELGRRLAADGMLLDSAALTHVTMAAELERLVVSGPTRGRQTTFALISERAPLPPGFDRDAAVATLVRRYFSSHGPATLADCAWWCGLASADVG